MSNSSLYGVVDRRVPQKRVAVHAEEAFDRIWRETRRTGMILKPSEKQLMETSAFTRAMHNLPDVDRKQIKALRDQLMERLGRGVGAGAALQILGKLGVFLNEAGGMRND